jgi:hypothetical protein
LNRQTGHPFGPTATRRRTRWPWILAGILLITIVLLGIGTMVAWTAWIAISEFANEGISIVVDGQRWDGLHAEHVLAALAGLGLAGALVAGALLLCLGLIVPLALAIVLLVVGLVISAVLAAVGVALGLALLPLWLPLLLLWLLLRPSRSRLASSPA